MIALLVLTYFVVGLFYIGLIMFEASRQETFKDDPKVLVALAVFTCVVFWPVIFIHTATRS